MDKRYCYLDILSIFLREGKRLRYIFLISSHLLSDCLKKQRTVERCASLYSEWLSDLNMDTIAGQGLTFSKAQYIAVCTGYNLNN